ncbi:MAG: protein kinase domain-containing protein [Sulfobacillus sp.]
MADYYTGTPRRLEFPVRVVRGTKCLKSYSRKIALGGEDIVFKYCETETEGCDQFIVVKALKIDTKGYRDPYEVELSNTVLMNNLILNGRLSAKYFMLPLDAYICDGIAYIIMEGVVGKTLQQYLSEFKGTSRDFIAILIKIFTATAELEHNKISHNDLHTRNIIVTSDGNIKIIDYGRLKQEGDKHNPYRHYVPGYDNASILTDILYSLIEESIEEEMDNGRLSEMDYEDEMLELRHGKFYDLIAMMKKHGGNPAIIKVYDYLQRVAKLPNGDFTTGWSGNDFYEDRPKALQAYTSGKLLLILSMF